MTDWETWERELRAHCARWEQWTLSSPEQVDTAAEQVLEGIMAVSEDTVPKKKICLHSRPGYSPQLAPLKQAVKRARRWWRMADDDADWERFRQARHDLGRASRRISRQAHRDRVEEAATSLDMFWRLAKWARIRGVPRSSHTPSLRTTDNSGTITEHTTTEDKARCLKQALFPPASDADLSDIDDYHYPTELPMPEITPWEIERAILKATPFNAPGPKGVPNAAWKHSLPTLLPWLVVLFNACLRLGHCPQVFRHSITVAIRKPGKPDYTDPKAWRPISLLETLAKVLESVITTRLSYFAETHRLLPDTHFGG